MLKSTGEGLWWVSHPQRVAGADFGTRTTVMRLPAGGLLLHAPGPLGAEALETIRGLGPVRALVAPNLFHHLHLRAARRAFPEARVYGAPGLSDKLDAQDTLEVVHHGLRSLPAEWAPDLDLRWVRGMPRLNELVFLHRPSRTLVLTDLAFNVRGARGWSGVVFKLLGCHGRLAPSRYGRALVRDRAQTRADLEVILGWEFDRVTLCHGAPVEADGVRRLRAAWGALLRG